MPDPKTPTLLDDLRLVGSEFAHYWPDHPVQLAHERVRVALADLDARGAIEVCGGTSQMGCAREVWMGAKGLATQPIGYRCSECEQPFCATCIKGQKHAARWLEPCRDTELESWANQAIAAQKRAKELEAALAGLPHLLEGARLLAEWASFSGLVGGLSFQRDAISRLEREHRISAWLDRELVRKGGE